MLVFALIIAIILILISIKRYGKIFNPYTLEVYIPILFILLPQFLWLLVSPTATTYLYSDLAIITYLVAIFLGTLINIKAIKLKGIINASIVNTFNIAFYLVLIIPLLFYFSKFSFSFVGIRDFYENIVFSEYASFFELSKYLLYFIIVLRLFRTDKFDIVTLLLSLVLLLYGSKYALFDLIIILFIYYEQFRRLSIKKFVAFALIIGALFVSYRYYQTTQENSVFDTALAYFDLYENQTLLIRTIMEGEHDYYYGRIYFSSYLKYIPRAIWKDKPRAFGFAILNYDFYPSQAAAGYMPAFGLGSIFADFGFLSILVFGFVSGLVKNYLYRVYLNSKNNISFILFAFPLTFVTISFLSIQLFTDFIIRIVGNKINLSAVPEKLDAR